MGRVPYDSLPIDAPGVGADVTANWRNPDWTKVEGTDMPWLYTSALSGPLKLQIRLAPEGSPSRRYRVRLFFCDLDGMADSTSFDAKLQAKTAVSVTFPRKEPGSPNKPLIKEATVDAADQLTLELLPRTSAPPAISGMQIEVIGTQRTPE